MQVEHLHFPPIIAALTVITFGWAFQFFHLKYKKRARGYFSVFIFVLWGVPLVLAAILGMQFQGGKVAESIAAISPLASITTGSLIGLIAAVVPALAFGIMLRESVAQFEREILDGEIPDEEFTAVME